MDNATGLWMENLRSGGYEPPRLTVRHLIRLRTYSRVWRRLNRLLRIRPHFTFFEFGCGGGAQLVPLAYHGHEVAGIDVSPEVLDRCRAYSSAVAKLAGRPLPLTLHSGDFLTFEHQRTYDVVFNFGVIEHILDDRIRLTAIERMLMLTKPGGHVVSVVPSGMHPLRERMRREGLGGYFVPEIDYTAELAGNEMIRAGAVDPIVEPVNLFGYLLIDPDGGRVARLARRVQFAAAQLIPPARSRWAFRHASALIIIGRKPPSPIDNDLSLSRRTEQETRALGQ